MKREKKKKYLEILENTYLSNFFIFQSMTFFVMGIWNDEHLYPLLIECTCIVGSLGVIVYSQPNIFVLLFNPLWSLQPPNGNVWVKSSRMNFQKSLPCSFKKRTTLNIVLNPNVTYKKRIIKIKTWWLMYKSFGRFNFNWKTLL